MSLLVLSRILLSYAILYYTMQYQKAATCKTTIASATSLNSLYLFFSSNKQIDKHVESSSVLNNFISIAELLLLVFYCWISSEPCSSAGKMLAVFEKAVGNPPEELSLPWEERGSSKAGEEIAEIFRSWRPDSTLFKLSNGNFMVLSHEDESPIYPRSMVVMEDIFCIFNGCLYNTCHLRRHYGLSRQATEAMVIVEAYKVLRDRAPYPADQVIKELEGKFAFILFDAKAAKLFLARDRDGYMQLQWGVAADGSLICSDDPKIIYEACGKRYTPFPPGCIFMNVEGLMSFDHPLNKVRAIVREDDEGNINAVIFQVDLFTRLRSIPRSGSAANWAGATVAEAD